MNQIPSEGEYCGRCPCRTVNYCDAFVVLLKYGHGDGGKWYQRCPQCLSDKPQILTEEEREILKSYAIQEWLCKGERLKREVPEYIKEKELIG
jgi:hypothetical protein